MPSSTDIPGNVDLEIQLSSLESELRKLARRQTGCKLAPYVQGGLIGLLIGGVASLILLSPGTCGVSWRSGNPAPPSPLRANPARRWLDRSRRRTGPGDGPFPSG